jgi:hypothetical protein
VSFCFCCCVCLRLFLLFRSVVFLFSTRSIFEIKFYLSITICCPLSSMLSLVLSSWSVWVCGQLCAFGVFLLLVLSALYSFVLVSFGV